MKLLRQPHTLIIILSLIAVINAVYLVSVAYGGGSVCDINETLSCGSVFAFPWAWIGPVPFPAIAVIVYPLLAYLAWRGRDYDASSYERWRWTAIIASLGILFNSYFLTHEVITGVYCPLCLICLGIIITIAFLSRKQVHIIKRTQSTS